ncbi:hypothetical protein L6452_36228 [Arctium lappa]|uniref:Uncharacterized protein n=1 Tax=Arctium lappa TaxID=4217 RepID=A0ACB8Y9Y3_ARCLA|nr:hypothetical protein L6452_36228 [Arctium lappa]
MSVLNHRFGSNLFVVQASSNTAPVAVKTEIAQGSKLILFEAMGDLGRTKEALLVMEYCDKSLVSVLESRGAGFFEEKHILLIFRDVLIVFHCNYSDLKAENLLLGPDGLWKLCDFGSTSMNHKRFERPEEIGIEEDNIRKHTTAYRSPEMWDLLLREVISEKVDIWALGCLLFRICYFKSAFDGESKLQVLNGNYHMTDLIRDMLQSSPASRPGITQARALLDWTFISMKSSGPDITFVYCWNLYLV